jgi:hypothetical protein
VITKTVLAHKHYYTINYFNRTNNLFYNNLLYNRIIFLCYLYLLEFGQNLAAGHPPIYICKKGEPVPEPIDRDHFKSKILYRTDSERHYLIAKTAQRMHKSISKTLDTLIDGYFSNFGHLAGIDVLRFLAALQAA